MNAACYGLCLLRDGSRWLLVLPTEPASTSSSSPSLENIDHVCVSPFLQSYSAEHRESQACCGNKGWVCPAEAGSDTLAVRHVASSLGFTGVSEDERSC